MVIADAHIHLFRSGYHGRYHRSPAGGDEVTIYESLRTEHGIVAALVVGYEGEPKYAGNNGELVALAAEHDWIVPLAYLEATDPPPAHRIAALANEGFAGFTLYLTSAAAGGALARWPEDALRALDRTCSVVSINATPDAIAAAGSAFAALPRCRILFSHLGLPGRNASVPTVDAARAQLAPLLALARHEHIGVKYSGLYAISDPAHEYPHRAAEPFVRVLVEEFGADRLYWGSDFSPALDHVTFAQCLAPNRAGIFSAAEWTKIMGGNLVRLLNLDVTEG